jgi:uncharacterized Zn finger protein
MMWPFTKKQTPQEPVIVEQMPCRTCGGQRFVKSGLARWWVACSNCGAVYQIAGVKNPVAILVVTE